MAQLLFLATFLNLGVLDMKSKVPSFKEHHQPPFWILKWPPISLLNALKQTNVEIVKLCSLSQLLLNVLTSHSMSPLLSNTSMVLGDVN